MYITDAKTFKAISQTNSLINSICMSNNVQKLMKNKFKKKIIQTQEIKCLEEYFILPNGYKYGEFKQWNSDGILKTYCYYIDNNKHCSKTISDDPTLLDYLHGEFTSRHNNNNLWILCTYINNKLYGIYKTWYDNGQRSKTSRARLWLCYL